MTTRYAVTPPNTFRGKPVLARTVVEYDDGSDDDSIVLIATPQGFQWYYAMSPFIPASNPFKTEAAARAEFGLK